VLAVGDVLNNEYQIARVLPGGGMSHVYLAHPLHGAALVVVKEALEGDDVRLLQAEYGTLSTLSHDAIPRPLAFVEDDGHAFLVEQLVWGETLEEVMAREHRLFFERAVRIGQALLDVLQYLHIRGIVYRDLKPGNVMLRQDGSVGLVDFGTARYWKPDARRDTVPLGTPGFAAPEQYAAQSDSRSDLFSLGALLHYLISGHEPQGWQRARLTDVPDWLADAVARALHLDRAERFQSAAEMRQALHSDRPDRMLASHAWGGLQHYLLEARLHIGLAHLGAILGLITQALMVMDVSPLLFLLGSGVASTPGLGVRLARVISAWEGLRFWRLDLTAGGAVITAPDVQYTFDWGEVERAVEIVGADVVRREVRVRTEDQEVVLPGIWPGARVVLDALRQRGFSPRTEFRGQLTLVTYAPRHLRPTSLTPTSLTPHLTYTHGRGAARRVESARPMSRTIVPLTLLALLAGLVPALAQPPSSEAALLSNVRQLTFDGKRSGEGYFSADGSLIVFQSERSENPFYQIYLMDLGSGETARVSPGTGKTTCAWIHPDGRRILFASTHADPRAADKQQGEIALRKSPQQRRYAWDYDEQYDLWIAEPRGENLVNLTRVVGYDAEGSFSPDGQWIAFASNRHASSAERNGEDPSRFVDIYLMRADGSDVRRLTETLGYDGGPFFSPDGKRICWRRFTPDGATAEIMTMRVDGTDVRQLTTLKAMSWAPYYHPSGDYLIFATNLQGFGNFELYVVDAEGKHAPVRVSHTDGFDGLPVFTPDGNRIAWTSGRTVDKRPQIFVADFNDAEARRRLGLQPRTGVTRKPASTPLNALRRDLETLASAKMEGRLTGTAGERLAAEYVAKRFKAMGLAPAGDNGTYLQKFPFTAGVSSGPDNRLEADGKSFAVNKDWRPLAFARNGKYGAAEVVYAGYGIVAPAGDGMPETDAYVHLDVKNKWVMVFRYLPENITPQARQHLSRFSGLRYKAMTARDRGALGLIVVSGPNAGVKEPLVKLTMDATLGGASIPAISVSDVVAQSLLKNKSLKTLQDEADTGKAVMGFRIPDSLLSCEVDIVQEKRTGHNVLARLPAAGPSTLGALVVGAHVDHLGRGQDPTSLARSGEKGKVHYGADDNASGVAGILEIARVLALRRTQLKREVIFAAWSGEELGLLGASYFTRTWGGKRENPHSLQPSIAAYLNLDMVGRLKDRLVLQGFGSSSFWPRAVERAAAPLGLAVVPQDESYLPTDATAFYLEGVPILNAFTGAHAEYHSPRDLPSLINWEGLARVVALMARVAEQIATSDATLEYRRMEKPSQQESRAGLRAYLGTIPDYAQGDVQGVKLSGVAAKGPAEAAGVRAGDVIVELAGRRIDNIYDYTYAIEALKIGVPVKVVVTRDGQRVEMTVTPTSRE